MKRILSYLTLALCLCACVHTNSSESSEEPVPDTLITRTVLYRPGDYGSSNYRIPAIITAKDGSLVVATTKEPSLAVMMAGMR